MSSTDSMIALIGGGGTELTQHRIPLPTIGSTEVLVRVRAVALNNADPEMAADALSDEYVAGFEFAGDIVELGDGVSGLEAGRRVMGSTPHSFAQYVTCDYRHLLPMPDSIDYVDAAPLTTGLLTEYGALRRGGFSAGDTVTITGATSAIGLIGIRIARALGAGLVIATSRTSNRSTSLHDAGADVVVATSEQDLTSALLVATEGKGVDIVLDHVGGSMFGAALPGIRKGGSIVNIGRLGGTRTTIDLDALSYRLLSAYGVSFGFGDPDQIGDILKGVASDLLPAIADGRVRATIDSVHTFDSASHAFALVGQGRSHGKVVMTVE
ncbi:alcohol dehydrogenase [Rhodococcus sp. 06-156-3C]|uniref:quinone oxidoreductase family protein n=1 Tax=Nocardiaceae TaxID=85025 RepID=UPI000522EF17|nr:MULTISPECIES: zinc-binding dehydrogenase [Rhodococcus]OZD13036.1 alcohol dehydrogenase [Rhodococcus sp. 06-156-4a]OZD17905.1 alcohol dehydrogenase [Rhodococcus sp. 06-156-3C]OZD20629.1 alcohol dehydrogenase [Rhodococcus sp. 06-156-4C]OZD30653.1 alcohol dehydrogenase [Rhodococcus sp. 06-156-3b]OZD32575.1 alcohol dehydrogenase [Rhodococcus sp. 06-156-3]